MRAEALIAELSVLSPDTIVMVMVRYEDDDVPEPVDEIESPPLGYLHPAPMVILRS